MSWQPSKIQMGSDRGRGAVSSKTVSQSISLPCSGPGDGHGLSNKSHPNDSSLNCPPQVKEACDHRSAELSQCRASLAQTGQRERRSSCLVQELTAMVKEQKRRISELSQAKKEAVQELKVPSVTRPSRSLFDVALNN